MSGMGALYRKEMSDHIHSKRFLIVLLLILLTSCASIYGALSSLSSETASDSGYIFLKLFTLSGNSIPSFTSFIALLGPFVGLALGFDAINSERSEGTLNRLVAQPIYRDAVINGKFLAGATIIFLMVFSMGLIAGEVGLLAIGGGTGTGVRPAVLYFRLYLFLAGALYPVLRAVPPCGHVGYGGDCAVDLFRPVYDAGRQHRSQRTLPHGADGDRIADSGQL